jgi:hypothetical protein
MANSNHPKTESDPKLPSIACVLTATATGKIVSIAEVFISYRPVAQAIAAELILLGVQI